MLCKSLFAYEHSFLGGTIKTVGDGGGGGGGIKSILFLDDGIAAQKTASLTQKAAEKIQDDLTRAGFAINYKKSDFTPKQVGKWLGVIIDTTTMTFYVPEEKLRKIKRNLRETLQQNTTTPKELAKLAGTLSSMHFAIGPLVRLFAFLVHAYAVNIENHWGFTILASKHRACKRLYV